MEQIKVRFGNDDLIFETGKLAKQADGSVVVRLGETVVLVTAVCAKKARERDDYEPGFVPLTVEYQEKSFAAGRIPGGFFKREGKPSEKAILTSRMIDRPIRPLFPDGMLNEIQVIATVLSVDEKNVSDILSVIGASCALTISDIPFNGPIASARVGFIDNKFVINPNCKQMEESNLDLIVVANANDVLMLEVGANQLSEETILEGIKFGHENLKVVIKAQTDFSAKVGKEKREDIVKHELNKELYNKIRNKVSKDFVGALLVTEKNQRIEALEFLGDKIVKEEMAENPEITETAIKVVLGKIEKEVVREIVIKEGKRLDGRGFEEIRPLSSEINLLPRAHGSALFTRGETQALSVTTLGTIEDEQKIDALEGEYTRTFMLHYNFPPFSVGEAKTLRGPGRREIGHGALAAKALTPVLPDHGTFPYTIRLVSEILESNGSSSMATVCASSMSLMGGGVPIKAPVAGVAMGLFTRDKEFAIVTDIAGVEDHSGDMDFKVAGTSDGVTAVQLDLKIKGISYEILTKAFAMAKKARFKVLEHMAKTIEKPMELSNRAPRIEIIKIDPEKIRDIIGPGGKMIKKIVAETGAEINVEDDGTCHVSSIEKTAMDKALRMIKDITDDPEVGKIYNGRITKLMNFGAFCEFMQGREGLIHVSEVSDTYVRDVSTVLKEGDDVKVILFEIDNQGRYNLSIKRVKAPEAPEANV
ncbi:polynucleotide phosphorylase/polyadenylase [Candidatus Omnitrophus magneticus]|uniref:Polyribonucleotide nucleotidyltransferase n=1 Tax=Candidatus Omnitrophus magneticus TaxID=1609969 RepID=A0A0F0CR83_9BACT|nr:polynucleotide phosphorylase/polyadenylase [Candidatus Omnitrophus magneticus]